MNIKESFAKELGEFGYLWAEQVKGNKFGALPSIKEVVDGIYNHYCEMISIEWKDLDQQLLKVYLKDKKLVFDQFLVDLH